MKSNRLVPTQRPLTSKVSALPTELRLVVLFSISLVAFVPPCLCLRMAIWAKEPEIFSTVVSVVPIDVVDV